MRSCVLYNGMIAFVFTYLFFFVLFCFVLLRVVSLLFNDPFGDFRRTRWQIIEFSEPCCCFVLARPLHSGCFVHCIVTVSFYFSNLLRNFRLPLRCGSGLRSSVMIDCVNSQNSDGLQVCFFKIYLSLCFSIRIPC